MSDAIPKTKPIGRALRLLGGVGLMILAVPVYLKAGWSYNLKSLGVVTALAVFYIGLYYLVSRYSPNLNKWLGAVLAVVPVAVVFILGQGGGPIFGQGEGATGAITYIGISLLIDFIRADAGCEVMALPGLLFKERTHLACIALSPIDWLEAKTSASN